MVWPGEDALPGCIAAEFDLDVRIAEHDAAQQQAALVRPGAA